MGMLCGCYGVAMGMLWGCYGDAIGQRGPGGVPAAVRGCGWVRRMRGAAGFALRPPQTPSHSSAHPHNPPPAPNPPPKKSPSCSIMEIGGRDPHGSPHNGMRTPPPPPRWQCPHTPIPHIHTTYPQYPLPHNHTPPLHPHIPTSHTPTPTPVAPHIPLPPQPLTQFSDSCPFKSAAIFLSPSLTGRSITRARTPPPTASQQEVRHKSRPEVGAPCAGGFQKRPRAADGRGGGGLGGVRFRYGGLQRLGPHRGVGR